MSGQVKTCATTLTEEGLKNSSAKLLPKNAVLLTSRATIGFTAVARKPIATNQGFANFICTKRVLPEFLAYSLRASKDRLLQISGGTTFKEVNRGNLRKLTISLPPLAEQQRIVEILDRAAAIQRLRRAAEEKAREIIPALFVDMFGDPATNPKGWPLAPMQDVAPLRSGFAFKSSDYKSDGIPLIRISNIDGWTVRVDADTPRLDRTFLKTHSKFVLSGGELLIAMSGATTGKLGHCPKNIEPCLLNQRVGIFDCNSNKCIAPFIFVLLQLPYINDKIVGEAWGAAQPNVSPKAVGRIKVPLPPMNLQKEFSARLDVVYATLKMRADAASLGQTMASSLIAKLLG